MPRHSDKPKWEVIESQNYKIVKCARMCVCVSNRQLTGIKTLSYIDQEAFKDLPNLKYL